MANNFLNDPRGRDVLPTIVSGMDVASYLALLQTSKPIHALLNGLSWQDSVVRGNQVLNAVLRDNKNVLMTGPGGAGKSYTIGRLAYHAKRLDLKLVVVSTTGVSASLVDGITLHSYFGIGTYKNISSFINNRRLYNTNLMRGRINEIDVLVIEEVSMLDAKVLELIEYLARTYRDNQSPFGGIRVVFSGDFHQLAPVMGKRAFRSPVWAQLGLEVIPFHVSVRQRDDPSYFRLLNRVRNNTVIIDDLRLLKAREIPFPDDPIKPIYLYATNREADAYNQQEYAKVVADEIKVGAFDRALKKMRDAAGRNIWVPTAEASVEDLKEVVAPQLYRIPEILQLKPGAQYYLTINIHVPLGIVNGTACTFVSYDPVQRKITIIADTKHGKRTVTIGQYTRTFRVMREDGEFALQRKQFPIKLGYAVTIHHSQGATLSKVFIDFSRSCTASQVYVALSRVRSIEDLYLKGFTRNKIKVAKEVLEFYGSGI